MEFRIVVLGVALFLAARPAASNPRADSRDGARPSAARSDSLRAYVDGLAAFGLTGQIVVGEGDSVWFDRAAGIADRSGRPVGPRTCFAVGSITKSLTAALVVRLARRGMLRLDDSLARVLENVPADKRGMTVRQLLTHTAGLPADAETVDEADPRDEVVRKILGEALRAASGTKFGYSNAGYQLLAAIVERAGGREFSDLVSAEILAPCGMEHSGTGAAAAARCREAAEGRNEWKALGSLREWRQRWAGSGAGDLVSNAHDLWRWSRALQGFGPLSRDELDTLLARRVPIGAGRFYGFGAYRTVASGDSQVVTIAGDVPGYHASARIEVVPPWRIVVLVTSGEHFGRGLQLETVQRAVWRLLAGLPVALPPATTTWAADSARALGGAWARDDGSRLRLTLDASGMRLGLSGPGAMEILLGPDSTGARSALDDRAVGVLSAAASPDPRALAAALHPVELELWGESLHRGIDGAALRLGPLREVLVRGTVPLPWLETGQRTYVTLRFARGDLDASLAWLDGGLLDVDFGEGRPHPVLLPVAPLAAGGFAAWDWIEGRTLRLEPSADVRGRVLQVSGAGGTAEFRPENLPARESGSGKN